MIGKWLSKFKRKKPLTFEEQYAQAVPRALDNLCYSQRILMDRIEFLWPHYQQIAECCTRKSTPTDVAVVHAIMFGQSTRVINGKPWQKEVTSFLESMAAFGVLTFIGQWHDVWEGSQFSIRRDRIGAVLLHKKLVEKYGR